MDEDTNFKSSNRNLKPPPSNPHKRKHDQVHQAIATNDLCRSKKHRQDAIIRHKWIDCSFNSRSRN